MRFTEIAIMIPVPNPSDDRLKAYVSVVLDRRLAIRDMKIIEKPTGDLFLAMPSRKHEIVCELCHRKSLPCSNFCGGCGIPFTDEVRMPAGSRGRNGHSDIVFPVDQDARAEWQAPIMSFYYRLLRRPDIAYGAWSRTCPA